MGKMGNKGRDKNRRYRIDFALVILTGNLTRYLTIRPLVESDQEVAAHWYPIRTWLAGDPLRFLPGPLRVRARHLLDSWPLFVRRPADAVILHAFETYPLYALLRWALRRRRRTVMIFNPDDGPFPSRGAGLTGWVRRLAIRSTDLFVPWTGYAADQLRRVFPEVEEGRIRVLNPGVDLSQWPCVPARRTHADGGFHILFVGADLPRKGIETLLDAYEYGLLDEQCELHIVTKSVQTGMDFAAFQQRVADDPNIHLHLDLEPNSAEIKRLYRESDVFVFPSHYEAAGFALIEAMAASLPIVATNVGGIPHILPDGQAGILIERGNYRALAGAIEELRTDEALRLRMGEYGREHAERHFDARTNTETLLAWTKALIDARRGKRPLAR